MLYYYNLQEIIKKLPQNITQSMDLSNDNIFNFATFNDLAKFYKIRFFRRDRYTLNVKLQDEHFYDFINETIIKFSKTANPNQLLLIYAMLAHYILEEEIQKYLSVRITKINTYNIMANKIDKYYTQIIDEIDLTKTSIYKLFPNSFYYTKEMNDLISHPMIKIYSFLEPNNYFTKAMKKKKSYYKRRRYLKFMDLEFLNLDKKPYIIGDQTYSYSLNEVIELARKNTLKQIAIINEHIFDKKDEKYNELFNITKE